jgi:hypothetical protein
MPGMRIWNMNWSTMHWPCLSHSPFMARQLGSYSIIRPEIHSDESMVAATILSSVSLQYPFPRFHRLAFLCSSIEVRLIPGNTEQEICHIA